MHQLTTRSAWAALIPPGAWTSQCPSSSFTSSSAATAWQARASGSPSPCGSATSSLPSPSSTIRARAFPASWTASATTSRSSSSLRCPSTSFTSASAIGTANETASTHGPAGKRVGDLPLIQTKGTALQCSPFYQFITANNAPTILATGSASSPTRAPKQPPSRSGLPS